MNFAEQVKEIGNIRGDRFFNGILKISERERELRPSFSYTWVTIKLPEYLEKVLEYYIKHTKVSLYRDKNSTDDYYYIAPNEYTLDKKYYVLLNEVMDNLYAHSSIKADLSSTEGVRRYIKSIGKQMISKTSEKLDISLEDNREETASDIQVLVDILTKYTAGYGVVETLLRDPHVQDIYIDAPSEDNNVYVELGGVPDIRDKCRTNIYLTNEEVESMLARFRAESGKPFSEAFPVLETNLKEFETRITAIGRPLSQEGIALALRRRNKEPWTLPKLIRVGSMTPLAAGLLSFLVDGRSTLLVAGSRGAGKTSILSALMMEFPRSQRILTIEDTRELPSRTMQQLGYNIQSLTVGSLLEKNEMTADDALRVSLRLGESSLVLGEVRGKEARTLYEAMRAGTAGSAVMGTIHGDSPDAVYERVVFDMGISEESFSATDLVLIAGMIRPGGTQRRIRTLTHVSEYEEGTFTDLMRYDNGLKSTNTLKRDSERIGHIARSWAITYEQAIENINLRSDLRAKMVETSKKKGMDLLSPSWVSETNDKFWNLVEEYHGTGSHEEIKKEWMEWYEMRTRYV
ncbi:MAG: type II/IV secretion system ATPase subunit [Thermoplasmata archaeon]